MPEHLQEPSLSHRHGADEASGNGYVLGGKACGSLTACSACSLKLLHTPEAHGSAQWGMPWKSQRATTPL